MPKKRFSAEQIVTLLRQIEVLMAQGKSTQLIAKFCRDMPAKRRNLLQPERGTNCHRAMAQTLQRCFILPISLCH
jgi:hypothetical protein